MDAFPVSELLRSKQLLQRKGAKSDVWNFFGFKMDPDDESEILDHSKVICALCERQLCYNGVSTTMLRNHLRVRHPGDFLKVQDAPSNAPSTHSNSDVGAFPSRLKTKKTPSSQLKTDVSIFIISLCACVCVCMQALPDNSKTWSDVAYQYQTWLKTCLGIPWQPFVYRPQGQM